MSYRHRSILAVLAVASMAATSTGWSQRAVEPAAGTALACARPVDVPWVGRACPGPQGGWEVTLPDGYRFLTHGGDYVEGHLGPVSIKPKKPACVQNASREFHTRVIYAYPSGGSNRYSSRLKEIRGMLAEANGFIRAEAARQKRRMDLRVACNRGEVAVTTLKLPTTLNASSFDAIIQALRVAGYSSTMAKYWVWLEGHPRGAPGGIGTLAVDDRLVPDNKNNNGPSYNVTFGIRKSQGGAGVMLHEGSHNFGAVQGQSAPYGSGGPNGRGGGMHCNDGLDVMCYRDGGSLSKYSTRYCDTVRYDCRNNTYFNTRPKKGSYLATRWNLGSPINRWFSGCNYRTGLLTAGAAGQTAEPVADAADTDDPLDDVSYRDHSVSSSCVRHPFAVSAVVAPNPDVDKTYGTTAPYPFAEDGCFRANGTFCQGFAWQTAARAPVPDVDVCFYKRSRQLRCYDAGKYERGTVPTGTTRARVSLKAGANAIYALNIV